MLEVQILKSLDECFNYAEAWKNLVDLMSYPSPFVHPDWVTTALRVNSEKCQPYVLLVKEGQQVVGVLPLYKKKKNRGFSELGFAGDCYYPDPLGLCCKTENRKKCIDALMGFFFQSKDWDILRLNWLLHDEAMEWENERSIIKNSSIAPFITLPKTFRDYLSHFRKKINFAIRKVKKFEADNGLYFSTQSIPQCRELLDRLFFLHNQRSMERGIKSSFWGDAVVDFHKNILDNCDNVYVHWLTLNNEIIAVLYGFLFQKRFFYYQIAHDPKHGALSPGAVLLYKSIEQSCEIGVQEFNFLQGDEAYKWKWAEESRRLYAVKMYNRSFSGALLMQNDRTRSFAKNALGFIKKGLGGSGLSTGFCLADEEIVIVKQLLRDYDAVMV